MKRTLGKYFPGIVLVALIAILSPTNAYASTISRALNTTAQSFSTVNFKVAPELTTNGSGTGIQTFTSGSNGVNYYFYYVNTGTVNVNSFTWTIIQTFGANPYTLNACPINTTFNSPAQCSDLSAPTTIALTGTGPALTLGQWRPIHLLINKKNDIFTAASTVSSSQIRAATNTVA